MGRRYAGPLQATTTCGSCGFDTALEQTQLSSQLLVRTMERIEL